MKRDTLHNIIVQAFAAGVEASLTPMPPHIKLDKENMVSQVQAYLNGKALRHAVSITTSPSILAQTED